MEYVFFNGWDSLLRILITTLSAYIIVVVMLRISGKRTLAKMNAFDFIVTIALGSILASMILNKSTPLLDGLLAIALLIFLQYCITFISVRNKAFKELVSSSPTLLYYKGEIVGKNLRKERVSIEEINKSVRESGFKDYSKIEVIVLESTGDISVVSKSEEQSKVNKSALDDVSNIGEYNDLDSGRK